MIYYRSDGCVFRGNHGVYKKTTQVCRNLRASCERNFDIPRSATEHNMDKSEY